MLLHNPSADLLIWKRIAAQEMPGCEEGGDPSGGWRFFLKDICQQSDFINDVYQTMEGEGLLRGSGGSSGLGNSWDPANPNWDEFETDESAYVDGDYYYPPQH